MGNLFSEPPPTPRERARKKRRELERSIRNLDNETNRLEHEKTSITQKLRHAAENGENDRLKPLAKEYQTKKKFLNKFSAMKLQLETVQEHMRVIRTNEVLMSSLQNAANTMKEVNHQIRLAGGVAHTMFEFERANDQMEITAEMMDDATDGIIGSDSDEENEEQLVSQVLDELHLRRLADAPAVQQQTSSGSQRQRDSDVVQHDE